MESLPFTAAALLAPMEGVTEPCFRDLVLECNAPEVLGGAFTEFARVSQQPLPLRSLRQHLGNRRHVAPVGLQIMGANVRAVAETARRAKHVGAPLVDLNFGCPAKGALRGCAGSALLDDPPRVEVLVRACVDAVEGLPVSAKIRAGGEDDTRLEEIASAVEAGGASLLTLHCRTRREGYRDTADWSRLRRAVATVSIPVCGNGGIEQHADIVRMCSDTGCSLAMIGRAAMADPWIFSNRTVSRAQAAQFLHNYAERLRQGGATPRKRAGRLKQLLRSWRAGALVDGVRSQLLGERDDLRLLQWIASASHSSLRV